MQKLIHNFLNDRNIDHQSSILLVKFFELGIIDLYYEIHENYECYHTWGVNGKMYV